MGRDTGANVLTTLRGELRITYANSRGLTPIPPSPIVQTALRIHSASAVKRLCMSPRSFECSEGHAPILSRIALFWSSLTNRKRENPRGKAPMPGQADSVSCRWLVSRGILFDRLQVEDSSWCGPFSSIATTIVETGPWPEPMPLDEQLN